MTIIDSTGEPLDKILISDLPERETVRTYFLCSQADRATASNGKDYFRLTLSDASGSVPAIHFDPSDEVLAALRSGSVVRVEGTYDSEGKFGRQFKVQRLRILESQEYDPATLVPVSPIDAGELRRRLAALRDTIGDPALKAVVARALDPSREPGATFDIVPAAVRNHHAYRHGLLEHSLVVAEVAAQVADRFDSVDRDLVVAGGLLHDIGKVRSYSADPFAPGLTDAGRLHGEIVVGYEILLALIAEGGDVAPARAEALCHIIVSHHGMLEKGSPAVPRTREAIIVHFCDDMTARIAAFDEVARATLPGEHWSAFSRMLDTQVFLGPGAGRLPAASDRAPTSAAPEGDQTTAAANLEPALAAPDLEPASAASGLASTPPAAEDDGTPGESLEDDEPGGLALFDDEE